MCVDFIKVNLPGQAKMLRDNSLLDFKYIEVSENDGEIGLRSYADYKKLKFTCYNGNGQGHKKDDVVISGSLHYYYNGGLHNYNQFSFAQVKEAAKDIRDKFSMNILDGKLIQLELGVNVPELSFNVDQIIDSLIEHNGSIFKASDFSKQGNYVQAEHSNNYIIKCYNKGLQNNIADILRFEIKYMRSRELERYGFDSLQNVLSNTVEVQKQLFNGWMDCTFIPEVPDGREFDLLRKWRNRVEWNHFSSRTAKQRALKAIASDLYKCGDRIKERILTEIMFRCKLNTSEGYDQKLLKQPLDLPNENDTSEGVTLTTKNEESVTPTTTISEEPVTLTTKIKKPVTLTTCIPIELQELCTESQSFTNRKTKGIQIPYICGERNTFIQLLDFPHYCKTGRICPITGLSISNQKLNTVVASIQTLTEYSRNYNTEYTELIKDLGLDHLSTVKEIHLSILQEKMNCITRRMRHVKNKLTELFPEQSKLWFQNKECTNDLVKQLPQLHDRQVEAALQIMAAEKIRNPTKSIRSTNYIHTF